MRYTDGGFSVAFFWPTNYAAQPYQCSRRRKPKSHSETKGPNAIHRENEQSNKCASKPQPVNRETSLIDGHQHGKTLPSLSVVTPTQKTSRRREVDTYANIPNVVANSSVSGCVESVKPDRVSLGSGLSDQELATDYELSDNENERTDSDSSIDNNLDHICTAKSTEFKLKDKIPGFEYISKTGHHV